MLTGPRRRAPLWVDAVIVVCMLPVFSLPWLLANCPAGDDGALNLLRIYPLYVVASGWLAWISWSSRPYMTWILLVVMLLSHLAAFSLVMVPR